jgi:hypothetical protein
MSVDRRAKTEAERIKKGRTRFKPVRLNAAKNRRQNKPVERDEAISLQKIKGTNDCTVAETTNRPYWSHARLGRTPLPMANDNNDESARINRLAKRAKELDDMIAKAAKMQKRIVEEIQRIGVRDRVRKQRMTAAERRKSVARKPC